MRQVQSSSHARRGGHVNFFFLSCVLCLPRACLCSPEKKIIVKPVLQAKQWVVLDEFLCPF